MRLRMRRNDNGSYGKGRLDGNDDSSFYTRLGGVMSGIIALRVFDFVERCSVLAWRCSHIEIHTG